MRSFLEYSIYSKLFQVRCNILQLLIEISHNHNPCIRVLFKDAVFNHIVYISQCLLSICCMVGFNITIDYVNGFNSRLYNGLPCDITAKGLDIFCLMAFPNACPTPSKWFVHCLTVIVLLQQHVSCQFCFLDSNNVNKLYILPIKPFPQILLLLLRLHTSNIQASYLQGSSQLGLSSSH